MSESKRCPNCGACKECGQPPVKMVPYPMPYPVPYYPHMRPSVYPGLNPYWQRFSQSSPPSTGYTSWNGLGGQYQ